MQADPRKLADRARDLSESNPMLGFRGCRLAIAYPEITEMQARAIFEAAIAVNKRTGKQVAVEVMVPLVATKAEFDMIKARIDATAQAVMKDQAASDLSGRHHDRAAARGADGRRDRRDRRVLLVRHQRPDADDVRHQPRRRRRLPRHLHLARHPRDRSVHLDRSRRRRRAGEDRRQPRTQDAQRSQGRRLRRARRRSASVAFCHKIGLDYVSCSPFRVPIARLAAAQAALGKTATSQA